jgi:hypothetical protein
MRDLAGGTVWRPRQRFPWHAKWARLRLARRSEWWSERTDIGKIGANRAACLCSSNDLGFLAGRGQRPRDTLFVARTIRSPDTPAGERPRPRRTRDGSGRAVGGGSRNVGYAPFAMQPRHRVKRPVRRPAQARRVRSATPAAAATQAPARRSTAGYKRVDCGV